MTIYTRSSINNLNTSLPRGWKLISAHQANSNNKVKFYISPEGKRFHSLQSVKSWLIATVKLANNEIIESPRKVTRRIQEERAKSETQYQSNNNRIIMSDRIIARRKMMAEKNPYRNLLKTTLKRNYRVKLKNINKRKSKLLGMINPRKRLTQVINQRKTASRTIISRLSRQRREG